MKIMGMMVFCGFYGYLCSRVYVKRYVTAYLCLSFSRTYVSFAFEVSAVCYRILLTEIVPPPVQYRRTLYVLVVSGGLPDIFWSDLVVSPLCSPSHPFTSGQ
jgi:hypothetical protein